MKLINSPNEYRLLQWSNDWMTVANPSTDRTMVMAPDRLRAEGGDLAALILDQAAAFAQRLLGEQPHTGTFWLVYDLDWTTGVITRRPDAPRRIPYRKPKKDEDDE